MDKKTSNDINYYSKGSGKPLYFVHGFPDCAENFEAHINFFSQTIFTQYILKSMINNKLNFFTSTYMFNSSYFFFIYVIFKKKLF